VGVSSGLAQQRRSCVSGARDVVHFARSGVSVDLPEERVAHHG
jgi:hypothetical protein